MGVYEIPRFARGTQMMASFLSDWDEIRTCIGGGNTGEAIENFGLSNKFFHCSTGGTAALAYLAGEALPGLEVLSEAGS